MKDLSSGRIKAFQTMIFSWWKKNKRDLPWRKTHDPYRIMISEVMLQQTQVSRVLPKYREFLALFPTVFDLSKTTPAAVLRAWKGMGYNRRALCLQKAAKAVVEAYNGSFPAREEELRSLPGIGKYTARAILIFAFKKDVTAIDTNIRNIIVEHFFGGIPQKEGIIEKYADMLLPKGKSWEWHQALMDYGALVNGKKKMKEEKMQKKKTIVFKETDRYFRGRIIDALREKEYQKNSLIHTMVEKYGKNRKYFLKTIRKLENEGLVKVKNGLVSLPE